MHFTLLISLLAPLQSAPAVATDGVEVRRGDLVAVFRDNSRSPETLSGIDSLFHRAAPSFDAFDPDATGASAGMNFEHIISGHENPHNAFSPRHGPFSLTRLPAGDGVRLTRRAADDPWSVESTLTYRLVPPQYIDVEFRCQAHDARKFGPRGYAIFFFCHYMNDVMLPGLHFRGVESTGTPERWLSVEAPPGHRHWNGGGTYIHRDAKPLVYDPDVTFKLNHWSYEAPRYTLPFYYGRAAHDMTLILMFDRAVTPIDEVRFSLFKFKLEHAPRPAWDFQYVVRNVQANREYGFTARLVWKKFISADDCLDEYRRWAKTAGSASRAGSAGPDR